MGGISPYPHMTVSTLITDISAQLPPYLAGIYLQKDWTLSVGSRTDSVPLGCAYTLRHCPSSQMCDCEREDLQPYPEATVSC